MMNKIQDFHCTYDNSIGVRPEVTEGLGLSFPDAYLYAETMAALARGIREYDGSAFAMLPFCHTVEAEAMGGVINMGNEFAGPRAKEYICTQMEEILDLPSIDFSSGRIHQVLLACRRLQEEREQVLLEVSGPFTILNVLINAKYVYKCLRRDPELAMEVFQKLGREVLRFVEEAKEYGVQFISYADSSGGVNILGPKMAEQVAEGFTYDFVRELSGYADEQTEVLLCPKTTYALLGTDKAAFRDIRLDGSMKYGEACIALKGKIKLGGMMCIKNQGYMLSDGIFREVVLKKIS